MSNYIYGCEYQILILANIFTLFVCFPASIGEYYIFGNLCNCCVCECVFYLWVCICIGGTTVSVLYVFGLVQTFIVIILIYMHIFWLTVV